MALSFPVGYLLGIGERVNLAEGWGDFRGCTWDEIQKMHEDGILKLTVKSFNKSGIHLSYKGDLSKVIEKWDKPGHGGYGACFYYRYKEKWVGGFFDWVPCNSPAEMAPRVIGRDFKNIKKYVKAAIKSKKVDKFAYCIVETIPGVPASRRTNICEWDKGDI